MTIAKVGISLPYQTLNVMTHSALQSAIRQTIALYAKKRDGATDRSERAYYGQLWQEAVNRLHSTLLYK